MYEYFMLVIHLNIQIMFGLYKIEQLFVTKKYLKNDYEENVTELH